MARFGEGWKGFECSGYGERIFKVVGEREKDSLWLHNQDERSPVLTALGELDTPLMASTARSHLSCTNSKISTLIVSLLGQR